MKIEFDYYEDKSDVQTLLNAGAYYSMLHEIELQVRQVWKYGMSKEDFYKQVEEIMSEFRGME